MREKLGWAASSPRIASAQARLAGDEELLSMMELLQKASMMSPDGLKGAGLGGSLTVGTTGLGGVDRGPLTGPAHLANENIFEKSFWAGKGDKEVQSPNSVLSSPDTITEEPEEEARTMSPIPNDLGITMASSNQQQASTEPERPGLTKSPTITMSPIEESPPSRPQRSSLKRTYTDVGGYSLQHRLTEALAQPYHATNSPLSAISTTNAPTFRPPPPPRSGTMNERAPHGTRNQAQAQAIFTTDAQSPWTITAANDLACLVFGVTRAEVRKLGIMEVIAESRRDWLRERLKNPESGRIPRQGGQSAQSQVSPAPKASPATPDSTSAPKPPALASAMGKGITAKLLSKPPSRESYLNRRSKTEGGNHAPAGGPTANSGARTTSIASPAIGTPNSSSPVPTSQAIASRPSAHIANKSRGVLLCGDVVPIRKMDGTTGSASLWVKEKGGGLIWVLEEIAEDVAFLTVDEIGSVIRGKGDIEAIWGLERVRNGMDVQRLIPSFPKLQGTNTGALDYEAIARLKRFTARTANSISIPITVEQVPRESTFRVSSFPHIAGILVLEPRTMRISSSNSVFSSALFGYANPDGLPITDLIPGFDATLRVMTDEDSIELVDGIVIPEHSFRRARALLALREGSVDAAAVFLRPAGLEARHRDGAEIMVDVQMRVVKSSDREPVWSEVVIEEEESKSVAGGSDVVYALWITYSRQLHAVNHGIGPVTPRLSRPSTPPQQPTPSGHGHIDSVVPSPMVGATSADDDELRTRLLTQQLEEAKAVQDSDMDPSEGEPFEHPSPDMIKEGATITQKKKIDDFAILEEMGQGAYGQVKLGRYKKPLAKKMVIKYVTKRRILVDTWHRDRRLGTVPLEIHVLDYLRRDGLQHPNIVEMADFFEDDINYYIEMVPHGLPGMDLFDYIELRVTMEESECRKIFRQVAQALEHLHTKAKVVHRDIKDENVVLDGEGRVKLVDFGSAAYIKSGPFDVFVGTIGTFPAPAPLTRFNCNLLMTLVDYAAPEVLRGLPYRGKEQDVWALGILLYTIVYKENPFYSIDEIMDHDLRVPYVMSEECIDLIRKMLDRDVERRIGIQAVLEHPWTTTIDDEEEEEIEKE